MRRSSGNLVKYKRNLPIGRPSSSSFPIGIVILVMVIGVIIYCISKNKSGSTTGQYKNLETWDIQYSPDGLPTKISIHREAKRT